MAFEHEYQCCYCDRIIAKADRRAVRFVLSSLWAPVGDATPEMFAQSACSAAKFGSNLSPSVPFDVEVFGAED